MCNHKPIKLYNQGGVEVICAVCRKVLTPWHRCGESGQAGAIGIVTLGVVFVCFAAWVLVAFTTENRVCADFVALGVFLAGFFLAISPVCNEEKEVPPEDREVE